jgi:hypothetical protein
MAAVSQVAEVDRMIMECGEALDGRLVGLIKQIVTVQLPEWKVRILNLRVSKPFFFFDRPGCYGWYTYRMLALLNAPPSLSWSASIGGWTSRPHPM